MLTTLIILYTDVSIGIAARESAPVEILEKVFILIKLLFTDFTKAKIQICKQRNILRNIKLNFRNAKIYMNIEHDNFRKPKIAPVQPEKTEYKRANEPDISQRGARLLLYKK